MIIGGEVVGASPPISAKLPRQFKVARMDTSGSFLLLFIFAVLIFGIPIIMIAIRLIETISEWRESIRLAEKRLDEDESTAEEKAAIEKKTANDSSQWTPAQRMR